MRPWASPVIIDECDQWMIIDKPALMAAHPSKPTDRETLWHHLCDLLAYERINGGQVSLINRLDRETSGLTLVAKTRASARSLCRQMEAHHIQKSYQALVHGWPERAGWTVDAPIARKGAYEPSPIWLKQTIHPEGSSARTRFELLQRFESKGYPKRRFSIVEAIPITGRMHQIRVHLAHSGHPIVGDKIYGEDEQCYLEFIETGWTPSLQRQLLLPRHALHASTLLLTESGFHWKSPLAEDIRNFITDTLVEASQ
jgi:23S rRNA pseudouridine1911/1915/1917 synthase